MVLDQITNGVVVVIKVEPRRENDDVVSSERRVTVTGSPEACWRVSPEAR